MMSAVWKYTLKATSSQIVEMPAGAKVLYAREQWREVCVWALVDVDAPAVQRVFWVYGTGQDIYGDKPTNAKYVGSAHLHGGALVFHVFDLGEVPT